MTGRSAGSAACCIACAHDLAAADTAAGHGDAPDPGPVVAAAGCVDPRSAAELACGDHERGFQPAAAIEIVNQRRKGTIESREQDASVVVQRAEGARAVAVPGDPVENRLEHVDRDHADARLDSRRQQAALPERRAAILISEVIRLLSDVEGIFGQGLRNASVKLARARTLAACASKLGLAGSAPRENGSQRAEPGGRCPCGMSIPVALIGPGIRAKAGMPFSAPQTCAINEPKWGVSSPARHNLPVWRSWQPVSWMGASS